MSRRQNHRILAKSEAMRASHVAGGRERRRQNASRILPCLAAEPSDGPVDGAALVVELARIAEVSRRGWSS